MITCALIHSLSYPLHVQIEKSPLSHSRSNSSSCNCNCSLLYVMRNYRIVRVYSILCSRFYLVELTYCLLYIRYSKTIREKEKEKDCDGVKSEKVTKGKGIKVYFSLTSNKRTSLNSCQQPLTQAVFGVVKLFFFSFLSLSLFFLSLSLLFEVSKTSQNCIQKLHLKPAKASSLHD